MVAIRQIAATLVFAWLMLATTAVDAQTVYSVVYGTGGAGSGQLSTLQVDGAGGDQNIFQAGDLQTAVGTTGATARGRFRKSDGTIVRLGSGYSVRFTATGNVLNYSSSGGNFSLTPSASSPATQLLGGQVEIVTVGTAPTTPISVGEVGTYDIYGGGPASYAAPPALYNVTVSILSPPSVSGVLPVTGPAAGGTSVGFGAPINGVDRITGGAGNDIITGIGTDTTGTTATSTLHDAVYGAVGDDTIGITGTNFTLIDAGSGNDILRFDNAAGLSLDLTAYGLRVQGFERIDLGTGANTLALSLADVLRLPDQTGASLHPLLINGGADDTVNLAEAIGTGWADSGNQTIGAVTYDVWHNATMGSNTNADLLIQQGISVV